MPNAAAGGIGLQRGEAALLLRFAKRNAARARAPFSPKWEMRGAASRLTLNEDSRRCGKAAFLRVREVAGTPKAAVRRYAAAS